MEPLSWVAEPVLFAIDSNGNLTGKTEGTDTWGYEWNARNELTRVTKNSVEQARFSYDPAGRRVEKVAGGVTSTFVYDRANLLRETRGSTTLKYVSGPDTDTPLGVESGSTFSSFHADVLGSIVRMTDAAAAVTLTRQYDAWGNIEVGASEPGYAFTGREWDPEVGLYYYRARYYDPRIGVFISEDSVDFANGMSRFAYVLGNPVGLIDPSGHVAEPTPSPAPPPPATPNTCPSCPPYVQTLFHEVCVEKSRHPDAAVRKCLTKRCYLEPITRIVCEDCPKSIGGYSAFAATQITLCNVPTRSSDCARKRSILHETLHTCYPASEDWVIRMSAGHNGGYYCGGVW